VIAFPNCKINLGLNILSKRSDGFHNLETVFYPLGITDALEMILAANNTFQFTCSGPDLAEISTNNLCVKAYELFRARYRSTPEIHMHLHKAIPIGAGLGGGSADAAFTLQLLAKMENPGITKEEL
jgi:4-diphosphocytidyl-2-C-methyl-D-erythritol kinase